MKNLFKMILLLSAFIFPGRLSAQPAFPDSPEQAKLIRTDVGNFLEALDKLPAEDESERVRILRQDYFEKGSPGLKEYTDRFNLTPEDLSRAIRKHPEKYAKIKEFYGSIKQFETVFTEQMKAYKQVVRNAKFAPTYLLVADYKGIGQASRVGQLVTIENRLENIETLKSTILHELTHFQQALSLGIQKYGSVYAKKNNMLDLILREGAADFVTYQLVGKNPHQFKKLENFEKNEFELWQKFKRDLENQDQDFWLNVSFENNNNGYPIQPGYAVGYKIVAAFYEKAEDKEKALREILSIEDPEAFLEKSGYQPSLSKLQKELMFGTPDPRAPKEIGDYRELIGISDCTSQQRGTDGTWGTEQNFVWTYKYILGGMAVQDETLKPDGFHTSSVREFSREDKKWYVHYFASVKGASKTVSTWSGNRRGDEIILYREQKAPNGLDGFYKIRFYEISAESFKWSGAWVNKDESFTFETWKISCRKRKL